MTTTSLPFGELLKALRSRRKLSQQELARRLGKHLNTIGSWERGDRLPDTKAMVLELARVLQLEDDETRQLLEASLTSLSTSWSVPYPRNPFFTGRLSLLEHLHQQLAQSQPIAVSQSYALSGLGGIGKTQLALEYAYQHERSYHAVFWVAAETPETLSASLSSIAELLGLPEAGESNQQKLVAAVLRWLSTHKEWLLILDNVEDLSLLKASLPAARQGAVLITTRLHALEGLAHPLELPAFSRAEALRFLLARARLADPALPLDEVPQEVLRTASALVKAMGGLPLALDQAGAYVERTGCSLLDYLRLYQRSRGRLLAERSRASDHPHSVTQTFLLSFEKLAQNSPGASDLLRLCAVLHPDAIPEELLSEGASQWSPALREAVSDALAFDQMMAELLRFSLVKRSVEQRALSLHRLVQAVLLEMMAGDEREQWLARAIAALDLVFPEYGEHESWSRWERLLPHALLCAQRAKASQEPLVLASLSWKAGEVLYRGGRYVEAEPLLQRALHLREQSLSADHLAVAQALRSLARLRWSQGKHAEAEPLYQRALHLREQALGPDHPDVADVLRGLATLYGEWGKYEQAEPLFQRALSIQERALGPEHSSVATTYANLAICYAEQGKAEQAEPLFQRALHILEQALAPDHSDVIIALTNLAAIYQMQGKYEQAEPLLQRGLAIGEHTLGPDHPHLAVPLSDLAQLYSHQGKDVQAEASFQRALRIDEQQLGAHHLQTAQHLLDFAGFREAQGNRQEAASLYQRALAIREEVYGSQHPKTDESRERLRAVLVAMGRDEEAAQLVAVQPESAET